MREKKSEENSEPDETVRGSFTVFKFIIIFFISMENPLQGKILCDGKRNDHSHQVYRIEERKLLPSDNYVYRKTERLSYSLLLESKHWLSDFCSAFRFLFFFSCFLETTTTVRMICKTRPYSNSKLLKIFSRENKKNNQCRREGIS